MPAENKSRFPMAFDKCPFCGDKETITGVAWAEEVEKGRVVEGTEVSAMQLSVALIDAANPPILLGGMNGILRGSVDYCASCGAGYCRKANLADAQIHTGPPGGGMPGIPPNRN